MAQTTGAGAQACAVVEVSTNDGASWTDISGSTQSVTPGEQTRMSGEVYTFDGEGAIITSGKKEPMDLTFAIVYTEETLEAYEVVRTIFEAVGCDHRLDVRYVPLHGGVGINRLSGHGPVTSFTYPTVDASTGDPIMAGFTVRVPELDTEVIAS